jgi:hypothetical protein
VDGTNGSIMMVGIAGEAGEDTENGTIPPATRRLTCVCDIFSVV